MYVSSINTSKDNYKTTLFKGNTNPKAILAKTNEVLNVLNITSETSYVAELLRRLHNAEKVTFCENLWKNLKQNIPYADTVEKLELLKSYGISLLSCTPVEITKFLKFLKSNPTDKDVYFLQTAMDIARKGEISALKGVKEHYVFDFEPVLDYVLSDKSNKADFARWNMEYVEKHIDAIMYSGCNNGIKTTSEDANNLMEGIQQILSGGYDKYAFDGKPKYLPLSIKSSLKNNKYINIGGIKSHDNTEITIGLSNHESAFYEYHNPVPPTERQLFVLLDKDNKLSKLKLFIYKLNKGKYIDDHKYFTQQDEISLRKYNSSLSRYKSPFQDGLPMWISYGLNTDKYMLKTIEYDAKSKLAVLKHYEGGSVYYPQKFKLVDLNSDEFGLMTDKDNPISFIPIEPTVYDLEQMINNNKTNNLLKMLKFSGWKDCFMKIITESLNA